jgi:hypothetical protein
VLVKITIDATPDPVEAIGVEVKGRKIGESTPNVESWCSRPSPHRHSGAPVRRCQHRCSLDRVADDIPDRSLDKNLGPGVVCKSAGYPQIEPACGGHRMAYRLQKNRMMGFGRRIALEFRGR